MGTRWPVWDESIRPITHRGEAAQGDLAMIRARAQLVEPRRRLLNSVRGMAKSLFEIGI